MQERSFISREPNSSLRDAYVFSLQRTPRVSYLNNSLRAIAFFKGLDPCNFLQSCFQGKAFMHLFSQINSWCNLHREPPVLKPSNLRGLLTPVPQGSLLNLISEIKPTSFQTFSTPTIFKDRSLIRRQVESH